MLVVRKWKQLTGVVFELAYLEVAAKHYNH